METKSKWWYPLPIHWSPGSLSLLESLSSVLRSLRSALSNLQKELESGFSRMLMIRFDIEHLTGKEAIELLKQREQKV